MQTQQEVPGPEFLEQLASHNEATGFYLEAVQLRQRASDWSRDKQMLIDITATSQIQLGQKFKDKITGFEGVATGYVRYISGHNQVQLAPSVGPHGALQSAEWFDEQRLTAIGAEIIALDNEKSPGFDRAAPKR